MSRNRREIGGRYEQIAADYLTAQGYEILERNYHGGRLGEVDLVAMEGKVLAFVEVKYRANSRGGDPAEAVNRKKQGRIRAAALRYLYDRKVPGHTACRFDVVAILGDEIRLIRDAF